MDYERLAGPRGARHRIVYKNLACSTCLNIYNGRSVNCRFATTHCVTEIGVPEVLQVAREQLAYFGARPMAMKNLKLVAFVQNDATRSTVARYFGSTVVDSS